MLEVVIKLHPFGDRTRTEVLYRAIIANDGTGTQDVGNYKAAIYTGENGALLDTCNHKNYNRNLPAYSLVGTILNRFSRNYVKKVTE